MTIGNSYKIQNKKKYNNRQNIQKMQYHSHDLDIKKIEEKNIK